MLEPLSTEVGHEISAALPVGSYSPSHSKPTLFYVVDWLPPDFGAVGQYAVIFADEIAQLGRSVVLVGLTSGVSEEMQRRPCAHGGALEVKRLPAKPYDKTGLMRRLIWLLRINLRLIWEVVTDPRSRGAEILFTGSPPFMLFFAVPAKFLRGARLIYRITDFYPEVLIAALGRRFPTALIKHITWFLRKRVDVFQVLGEDQRRLLIAGGIAPERIVLKRDVPPISITGNEKPASRPRELANHKVLLYSGNYGVAHEVDTVVEGLIHHHRSGGGQFGLWLNASGANVESIMKRLFAAGIPCACSDPISLDRLPALLAAADAHLITLRPPFSGLVLPSKIYACLASGRPILFVGPKSSDIHLLCTQAKNLYEHVEPGDFKSFSAALERFARTKPSLELFGELEGNRRSLDRIARGRASAIDEQTARFRHICKSVWGYWSKRRANNAPSPGRQEHAGFSGEPVNGQSEPLLGRYIDQSEGGERRKGIGPIIFRVSERVISHRIRRDRESDFVEHGDSPWHMKG